MFKATKESIFATFGIIYDPKTEKILDPENSWIKPLLKKGNEKVGETTYTYSLPAGKDGSCICDCTHCYAKEGRFRAENVKACLSYNQYLTENYLDFVRRAISAQLIADRVELVRIHAAGDFAVKNEDEYAAMWKEIALTFPNIRFWTYTKVESKETLFDDVENANIVKSLLPLNLGVNYGTCTELLFKYHTLKKSGYNPYLCACGTSLEKHCDKCRGCNENKIVLFILHSCAGYKLSKDPYLTDVLAILQEQAKKEGPAA